MNFDKESKSKEFFGGGGGGSGGRRWEWKEVGFQTKKKTICIHLLFVLMLYIKFQVVSLRGSLVLTQTKGIMDK